MIDATEEAALAREIGALTLAPFDFHGHLAHRKVASFGLKYDYDHAVTVTAPEIPRFLLPLRARVAALAGMSAEAFVAALVTDYPAGAGIGWHRDKPHFGEVIGVSLLSDCVLRFRRKAGPGWERATLETPARSAYLFSGPSRRQWEHSIAAVPERRLSVTFRTLAD